MSILKYKDPKTGEFKRINPYKADLSFVGKDGITIDKATDSEKVEISGKGCVQKDTRNTGLRRAYTVNESGIEQIMMPINVDAGKTNIYSLVRRDGNVSVHGLVPDSPTDTVLLNKKYVDANYVKKVKFTNLEQALNGYILDTTKEAYADLDSAVLKDSVAVGENVYPIADKTRALVTRIEGKTAKMVQLLDKSTYYNTQTKAGITATNNGDGSWTINGTATASSYINFSAPLSSIVGGHKILICGNKENSNFILGLLNQPIKDNGTGVIGTFNQSAEKFWGIEWANGAVINNVTITPQLFDLTAMNREDITTAEQFKAEFPDLYPYENGNIYPAKISGVKFTGKNLFDINQFENYNPSNTENIKVTNGELLITGYPVKLPSNHYFSNLVRSLKPNTQYAISVVVSNYISDSSGKIVFIGNINTIIKDFNFHRNGKSSATFTLTQEEINNFSYVGIYGNNNTKPPIIMTNLQIEEGSVATPYEPYTEPVSVTLLETYDLHGIGDYKDYLEITKNEDNELYTLKKVQSVEVNESEKTITPLETPVETVIATNLTYEQVTAIRHNGGLIEVEGNVNKGYARTTIKNTVVYRLTATSTVEG